MTFRDLTLLVGLTLPCAASAASFKSVKGAGPAATAAEIPVLARLLDKAGWTPTPEFSGVFQVGRVFMDDGNGHTLMVRECFSAEAGSDTYTATEVVSQMQAGVRVKWGVNVDASGTYQKKAKFGEPVHHTLERLAMVPTAECAAMLSTASKQDVDRMYAVQEVLTAVITEQTCGRIDADGQFVVGSAEAELQQACSQESLEPVAVAYRSVPIRDLREGLGAEEFVQPAAKPFELIEVAPPDEGGECPWGEIESVHSTMSTLTLNGQMMDVRGVSNRARIVTELQRCGYPEAAAEFSAWRANRRATNISCATLVGCYPFGVGIATAVKAKKHRLRMEQALLRPKRLARGD